MNYTESIDWLFHQFPAFQKIGEKAYKPNLNNIKYLFDVLEIDYTKLKYIHIAGTNGKGSVSNYTASILQECGLVIGLFTSPHIVDFKERIRVSGVEISEDYVVGFCNSIKSLKLQISPSFFEITFAMCIQYFIESSCEYCVIETGLGGLLDSTNILNPLISVITNVSYDHINILGNTIEEIAFQKAGIIKKHTPVVIGIKEISYSNVFINRAKDYNSPIYFADQFHYENLYFGIGTYMMENEKTVRKTLELLSQIENLEISEVKIINGLKNVSKNTGFKGRFQIIKKNPLTICDVAHNEDGFKKLFNSLDKFLLDRKEQGKLHVIYGASSDKDVKNILSLFPKEALVYFTEFSSERSFKISDFKTEIGDKAEKVEFFENILECYSKLQLKVNQNDIILICGSFYLLSDFFEK